MVLKHYKIRPYLGASCRLKLFSVFKEIHFPWASQNLARVANHKIHKLPWYPQQPKGCIFTNLSAACCEAASIHLSLVSVSWKAAQAFSGTFSGTLLTWPSPEPSPEPCWTWPGSAPSLPDLLRNLLRNPVAPDLALHQSVPELLRLFQNPVELDLALHQSLPHLLLNLLRTLWNLTWLCSEASPERGSAPKPPWPSPEPSLEPSPEPRRPGTFSGTFSGTLLNLTWLCTKASQTFSGTSLNLTRRLLQCTPELFWAEDPTSLRCWGIRPFFLGLIQGLLWIFDIICDWNSFSIDFIQVQHFGKPPNFLATRSQTPKCPASCRTLIGPSFFPVFFSVFLFGPCIAPHQINVEVPYLGLVSESQSRFSRQKVPHFHVPIFQIRPK